MAKEIASLIDRKCWELGPLPTDRTAIGHKWVYKTKLKSDGTEERAKLCFTAQGFFQMHGLDYDVCVYSRTPPQHNNTPTCDTTRARLFIHLYEQIPFINSNHKQACLVCSIHVLPCMCVSPL